MATVEQKRVSFLSAENFSALTSSFLDLVRCMGLFS